MRFTLLLSSLLLALSPLSAFAQQRRVVLVCPVTTYDGFDAKLARAVDGWLHDAVLARRIGRVDPATLRSELEDRDLKACPVDREALRELGMSLRASHVLLARLSYPLVVGGFVIPVDGPASPPVSRHHRAPEGSAVNEKTVRALLGAFVTELLPEGEDLLVPLTPPPPDTVAVNPPPPA